jgi:hypothetical protein
VSQSDDLPPPRRPLFFPVVIATVLLSIIGMSVGLVLGSRHEEPQRANDQTPYIPSEATDSPTGVACPRQMHETARGLGFPQQLTQVLKVRATKSDTEVWICRDDNGKLFYQANSGGDDNWVEGKTALFLDNVVPVGDGYLATATDGNTFDVNSERLEVRTRKGTQTSEVTPE